MSDKPALGKHEQARDLAQDALQALDEGDEKQAELLIDLAALNAQRLAPPLTAS